MPRRLLIQGATVVAGGELRRTDILCVDGRIAALAPEIADPDARVLQASGLVAGPGFVDVHVHGGAGSSFFTAGASAVRAYAAWAPRNGVTSFLVSTAGAGHASTCRLLAALAPAIDGGEGAEALGFHLEGPFLNAVRKGAFPSHYLRAPSAGEAEELLAAGAGRVRQVTIAPELPGALDVIGHLVRKAVVPAIGHSDATFAEARTGFEAGASHVTHLFNAMRPLHQREGGVIAAALLERHATCELICDGAHVAPEMLRLAWSVLGPSRMVLVTDNLEMAGLPAGEGSLGGEQLSVSGAAAVRRDGTIAGSVLTMDGHVRNLDAFLALTLPEIFRVASSNPARVAGAAARKGVIEPGFDADIVLLDERLEVVATVCRGAVAHLADARRLAQV